MQPERRDDDGDRNTLYILPSFPMFDPMADLTGDSAQSEDPTDAPESSAPAQSGGGSPSASSGSSSGGQYGQELHSITIRAKQRTFYIDLKESSNGKFFKISEKSRGGRKTTIMFDAEDLGPITDALVEMKSKL